MSDDDPPPRLRPSFETLIGRALRLKCPRCGESPLFAGWIGMPERCATCGFRFQREPGYYLGSAYINYGITAGIVTAVFVLERFYFGIPGDWLLWPLCAFCIVFPPLMLRHARALWLALDCQLDSSVLEEEVPSGPPTH